jgi:hypothetical protein
VKTNVKPRTARYRRTGFSVRHLIFLYTALLLTGLAALAGLSGCSRGNAVLVLDKYWPLSMKTEERLQDIVSTAERGCGMKIFLLYTEAEEDVPAALERYLAEEKPQAVITGAFSALTLRPVTENFPDIRFYVLDAPPGRLPPRSPFIWIRFDAGPVLPELTGKIRTFLERPAGAGQRGGTPGNPAGSLPALAFLDPAMDARLSGDPALAALNIQRIQIQDSESDESIRKKTGDALAIKPALYIIAAGKHSSAILDLIQQQGNPGSIVLEDKEDLPSLADFPVLASLEREYSSAIPTALLSDAGPGDILTVPMKIE